MRILMVGDIHGELDRFAEFLRLAKAEIAIHADIQVGYFGFGSDVIQAWIESTDAPFAVPVHAIDGNHEDHRWLLQVHREHGNHP